MVKTAIAGPHPPYQRLLGLCRAHKGSIAAGLAMTVAYFLSARLGLALVTMPEDVAIFWPAAGLAAGVLIAFGPANRVPVAAGVILGTLIANVVDNRGPWLAIAFGLANAGEALAIAELTTRWDKRFRGLNRLRGVFRFFAAAVLGTSCAAIFASLVMKLSGHSSAPLFEIASVWFFSDFIGIVTIAPPIIAAASLRQVAPRLQVSWENILQLTGVVLAAAYFYALPAEYYEGLAVSPILVFVPLVLWGAARSQPVLVGSVMTLIVTLVIIGATTMGVGRYGDALEAGRIVEAQVTILTFTFGALVLMSLVAERQDSEASLRASATQLQLALDASGGGTWVWDAATNRFEADAGYRGLYGFDGAEPIDCKAVLSRVHPDDLEQARPLIDLGLPSEPSGTAEFRIRHPHRGERWLAGRWQTVRDTQGRVTSKNCIKFDITERKRAERELRQHKDSQARSSVLNSMGVMAGALAHEINQPLTAARTYSRVVMDELGASPTRLNIASDAAQLAFAEVVRAARVVQRLRELLRPGRVQAQPVALEQIFKRCLDQLRAEIEESRVLVYTNIAPGLPALMVDNVQIELVLTNLVRNSLEAIVGGRMASGIVVLEADHGSPGFAEIRIRDTGPGFPLSHAKDDSNLMVTTKADGLGLGLSLSRSIIEAHGGKLWIGQPATGATVHITAPLSEKVRVSDGVRA